MKQLTYTQRVRVKLVVTKVFDSTLAALDKKCQKVKVSGNEQEVAVSSAFLQLLSELNDLRETGLSDYELLNETLKLLIAIKENTENISVERYVAADEIQQLIQQQIAKVGLEVLF